MNTRKLTLLVTLTTLAAVLMVAPAVAGAEAVHRFSFSFAGGEAPSGGLSVPIGVGVDQSTGDVWVSNLGHGVLDEFEPLGGYVLGSEIAPPGGSKGGLYGVAVDNSGDASVHDVYVADSANNVVDKLDPATGKLVASFGTAGQLGGLSEPLGVAVDSSGNLYVADYGANVVKKFNTNGVPDPTTPVFGAGVLAGPRGVAINAAGDVYVANSSGVVEFTSADACVNACAPLAGSAGAYGLTIDPVSQDLFATVGSGSSVAEYGPEGHQLESFGSEHIAGGGVGIATHGANVYVASFTTNEVEVFTELDVPDTTTGAASGVGKTTATVHGHVDPAGAGNITACEFEYGTEVSYGHSAPCAPAAPYSTPTEVSAELSGLTPGVTYHYRVDASNAQGQNQGADQTFNTLSPPKIESESANGITRDAATLAAQIDPAGETTTYKFEYSVSATGETLNAPVTTIKGAAALEGIEPQTASVSTGAVLTQNTTYYYRVVAENEQSRTEPGPAEGKVQSFTTALPPEKPETLTPEPITATTATLKGILNPAKPGNPGSYEFLYAESATECQGAAKAPEPAGTALGGSPEPQSAEVTGLLPGTTYTVCLLARNAAGETNLGSPVTFTTLTAPPTVGEASASNITSTTATLNAQVNPGGASTTYRFEYGTSPSYGASVPLPEAAIPGGAAAVSVSEHIVGLIPNTSYHYRIVAVNSLAPAGVDGPDQTFTTQRAGSPLTLPDGRQWEMVSPPNKLGAAILTLGAVALDDPIQASDAGNAITYAATNPIEAQPAGNSEFPQVLSLRGSAGWGSRDIAIPHEQPALFASPLEYRLFSEDLSHAIVQPYEGLDPSLSAEASEQTAFLRTDYLNGDVNDPCTESCYRPLVTGAPGFANVPPGTEFGLCEGEACRSGQTHCPPEARCGPQFQGASPDLSHVVVNSQAGLAEGPSGGLFEWSGGTLARVGSGSVGGEQSATDGAVSRHAVSEDGSRVIISNATGLFLRDLAKGETVELGPSQEGDKTIFQAASPDESKVFFNHVGSLEECEIVEQAGHLHCNRSNLAPGAYVFAPILGASEDGSYVYFATNSVLTGEEENAEGEKALPGNCAEQQHSPAQSCNLYVSHDGVNRFIAVLSGADEQDWGDNLDNYEGFVSSAVQDSTARVSPDGQWVTFMSQRSLTGYDNHDASSGELDEEVYLYDAAAAGGQGKLVCASCNPTGARPRGVEGKSLEEGPARASGYLWEKEWLAASVPGWTTSVYQSRYLDDSGRLFFDSSDALVPQDTNNTEDVYEYEPLGYTNEQGKQQCTQETATFASRSGGCVGLISSGTSPEGSAFLDASESGDDVFFLTAAQLSPLDVDTALDIYDAHVCSVSAPCAAPPGPSPPACVGDACQSPASAPEDATPGSLTFSGPGNVAQLAPAAKTIARKTTKCARGKKVEHGRCVKSKAKKEKRAKRSRARRASDERRARP
jgi:phosphodiesterase/alkaline phosphatase D-like protein